MSTIMDRLSATFKKENRLQAVMIELTHACPADCVHCFLNRSTKDEITFDEISNLFQQLADEGTINLGLTGGEPMARRDFFQILEEAKKHNFFISLLTTGTLIKQPQVDLLHKYGVKTAEISLLGSNSATHDHNMRMPGAFDRTISAIKMMRKAGIQICLKTSVMKSNYLELNEMSQLAEDLDCQYSANVSIISKDDGDLAPLKNALTKNELENIDPIFLNGGVMPDEDFTGGAILTCSAGLNVAGVSPRGDIYPCTLLPKSVGNIRHRTVKDIWHDNPDPMLSQLRGVKVEDSPACNSCELKSYCRRCPGIAYMETGSITEKCTSSCSMAEGIRMATINKKSN